MPTIKASSEGLKHINSAIKRIQSQKGWTLGSQNWLDEAGKFLPKLKIGNNEVQDTVSDGTWKRFRLGKKPIKVAYFQAFCQLLELDWQEIVDDSLIQTTEQFTNSQHQHWGDAPDIPVFFGREQELFTLENWVIKDQCRLIGVLGMGGIGKTYISLKVSQKIKNQFECIIWRSLLNAPNLNTVLTELLQFISNQNISIMPETIDAKMLLLLEYLHQKKCLIILDNAETLLDKGKLLGQYRKGYENYGYLFNKVGTVPHQSCLLFTSRELPQTVQNLSGNHKPVRLLQLKGLKYSESKKLFMEIDSSFSSNEADWKKLIEWYYGNPLALELVARHIQRVFEGNITNFLTEGKLIFGEPLIDGYPHDRDDLHKLLDWHFQRLSEEEQEVMFWLAINREAVSISQLRQDLVSATSKKNLPQTLDSLQFKIPLEKRLYESNNYLSLQPMLIEYMTEKIINCVCDEINQGQPKLLNLYAILKSNAKDYIRESQKTALLYPLQQLLIECLVSSQGIIDKLNKILDKCHQYPSQKPGYLTGNIINLLRFIGVSLEGYDFSNLFVWQADLQDIELHNVDFSYVNFSECLFTQPFGGIHATAFSFDGKFFAIGDSKCQIRLFTTQDRKPIKTFSTKGWWIAALAFSPCGKKIVSSNYTHIIQIWDIETGKFQNLEGHTQTIWTVTFHPSLPIIASGSDDCTIRIWDSNTGECLKILQGHENWVLDVKFSKDSTILASGSFDRTIKFWNIESGQCLKTLQGHQDAVWSVSWSPDGRLLASSGFEKIIRVWDTLTENCVHTLPGHTKEIKTVSISPNGQIIASGSFDKSIRLWNLKNGECLKILSGHLAPIRSLNFSPDGQTLVSGDNEQTVKFWNIKTRECIQTWHGYINWIWSISISPDGQYIASGHLDRNIRVWDIQTGKCIKKLSGHTSWIWSVVFSPDGRYIASSSEDETIKIWNLNTGEIEINLKPETDDYHGIASAIAWSFDGEVIACSYQNRTIKIWELRTKTWEVLSGDMLWSWSLAFSPKNGFNDGQILVSADHDTTLKVWDIKTKKCINTLSGHTNKVQAIAFHPHGQYVVSGSEDCVLKVWDIESGECVKTLEGHMDWIWSVAWSSNGQFIASAGKDTIIKVWDAKTGSCLLTLKGHTDTIRSLAFTPNSQILVSASKDGTIKLWNMITGECINTLNNAPPYEGMKITGVTGLTDMQKETLIVLGAERVEV